MSTLGTGTLGTGTLGNPVNAVVTWYFEPPVVYDVPTLCPDTRGPARDLFKWYGTRARGRTVLKENGTYVTVDYPLDTRVNAAERVYLGGHIYQIDETEALALTSAGFTVTRLETTLPIPESPPPTPTPTSGLYSETYAEVY